MFTHLIADLKARFNDLSYTAGWGALTGLAAFIGLVFGLIAIFIGLTRAFGPLAASVILAIVFFALALIAFMVMRTAAREAKLRELARRANRTPAWWTNPAIITTGSQLLRASGAKRSAALLVGIAAIGFLVTRFLKPDQDDVDDA